MRMQALYNDSVGVEVTYCGLKLDTSDECVYLTKEQAIELASELLRLANEIN